MFNIIGVISCLKDVPHSLPVLDFSEIHLVGLALVQALEQKRDEMIQLIYFERL